MNSSWSRGQTASRGSMGRRLALAVALGLGLVAALVRVAHANAGPPTYRGGAIAAEPGGLASVEIVSETLVIDMRDLARAALPSGAPQTVWVQAAYALANRGDPVTAELVFASGSPGIAEFTASLNGQPVASTVITGVELPPDWQPPATTPGLDGMDMFYLGAPPDYDTQKTRWGDTTGQETLRQQVDTHAFTVTLPSGASTLAVSYRSLPQAYTPSGYFARVQSYQFAYVLAPARAWGGFGQLDVTVRLAPEWRAAVRPNLAREGDVLRGRFDALPADAIALTVGRPASLGEVSVCGLPVAMALGAAAVVVARRGGRGSRRE